MKFKFMMIFMVVCIVSCTESSEFNDLIIDYDNLKSANEVTAGLFKNKPIDNHDQCESVMDSAEDSLECKSIRFDFVESDEYGLEILLSMFEEPDLAFHLSRTLNGKYILGGGIPLSGKIDESLTLPPNAWVYQFGPKLIMGFHHNNIYTHISMNIFTGKRGGETALSWLVLVAQQQYQKLIDRGY